MKRTCVRRKKRRNSFLVRWVMLRSKEEKINKGVMHKYIPPYPQSLMKKKEDNQFKRFIDLFSKLSVNIPLINALL